jgi:hypothetical protein
MNRILKVGMLGVCIVCSLVLMLGLASAAYGQSGSATITGRVLDPKGSSVPDATVTAINTETGITRTTTTSSDGLYRFENLPPGVYDVVMNVSGFSKTEAKNVKLQVGEARDINFNLTLAGQSQTVEVTSDLPLIESTKTDVSTVITDKEVAVLPTTTAFSAGGVANDYEGLALTAPGVRYDLTTDSSDLVGPGAVNDRGMLINIDGGNIIDQVVSTRDGFGASLEEVKEFQVLTNNYNAEYGQAGGVILNVITKSGTNSVHGDGHFYARGRNMGASQFFYNEGFSGAALPANPAGADFLGCPPSDFDSAGNIKSIQGCGRAKFFKHEGGFTIGGPFVKDRTFWFGSLEKTHQGIPLTLTPPTGTVTVSQPTKEVLWSAKLDHKLTNNHQFTVRFNAQRDITDNVLVQVPQNSDPESLVASVVHDHTLGIALVSTPTAHTVNEARFFWHRFLSQTPVKSALPGSTGPGFYQGAAFCCPQAGLQDRYQYIDNLSWTHGSHTIKTGANISRFPYFSLFKQFALGEFIYGQPIVPGDANTLPGAPGNPATSFTTSFGPGSVTATDMVYGAYVQDSWQIRHNITINYGVRYDLEAGAFIGGTTPNPAGGCFQKNGIIPACSQDHNNFQPRLGIAWSPNYDSGIMHMLFGNPGRSVVRASVAEVTELAYLNISLDSLNFDGTTLLTATTTDPAILAFAPNAPPASLLAGLNPFPVKQFGRIRPISPNLKNAETRHAALSISRQLTNSLVAEVGYIGVFGFGLYGERDTNSPVPVADPAHPGFFYFQTGPTTGDPTLPANGRPDNRFLGVRTNDNSRNSAYHGGYIKVTQRLAHHLQFQGNYMYSKTLGTSEDFFGVSQPANPFASMRVERAVSQQDIRHQGSISLVVDSEKLFTTPIVKQVLNNWNLGMIATLQSGRPYPLSTGDKFFATRSFPSTGSETPQRPNELAGGVLNASGIAGTGGGTLLISSSGVAKCTGTAGYSAATCPTANTFTAPGDASPLGPKDSLSGAPVDFQVLSGNLQRDGGRGSPYNRFDISLIKSIGVPHHESWQVQLKMDVFNVFNHPLYTQFNGNDTLNLLAIPKLLLKSGAMNPNFNPNCVNCLNPFDGNYHGASGQVLTIQDLRNGVASPDVANPLFKGVGDPVATDVARIIQLSVRLRF